MVQSQNSKAMEEPQKLEGNFLDDGRNQEELTHLRLNRESMYEDDGTGRSQPKNASTRNKKKVISKKTTADVGSRDSPIKTKQAGSPTKVIKGQAK